MKKIALASAAMGGVALITFGASGTFAALSDSATVTSSTVSAGSLEINATEATTAAIGGADMQPGETAVRVFQLANTGQGVTGLPTVQVLSIANADDGCSSASERKTDDCKNPNTGDLASQITMGYITYAPIDGKCAEPTIDFLDLGPLRTTGPLSNEEITLDEGESLCAAFELTFVDGADNNKAQGDSFTANVQFTLQQDTSV